MAPPTLLDRCGPWAVVTGSSDGIGRAMARQLAGAGLNLVLVAAAGFGGAGPFLEADGEEPLAMVDLNCRAVAALAHGFGRRLAARGRGALVLFSSLLAFQGVPLAANDAATKAYVQSLAEGLGRELAPAGITVLATAPGPVPTGFAQRAAMRMTTAQQPEEVAREILAALGRGGTVRPGGLARLLGYALLLLRRGVRVRLMGRVMAGLVPPQPQPSPAGASSPGRGR